MLASARRDFCQDGCKETIDAYIREIIQSYPTKRGGRLFNIRIGSLQILCMTRRGNPENLRQIFIYDNAEGRIAFDYKKEPGRKYKTLMHRIGFFYFILHR